MLSKEMEEKLISIGLTPQQAQSKTADAVINYLMDEDSKMLIDEAKNQVAEMKVAVYEAKQEYSGIMKKINDVAGILIDVDKVQKEFGVITDERAKNAISTFALITKICERAGAKGTDAITTAGYVTYAYLGGQARRTSTYSKSENNKILLGVDEDE